MACIVHIGFPRAGSSHFKREYLQQINESVVVPRGNLLDQFYRKNNSSLCEHIKCVAPNFDPYNCVISSEALCGRSFWNLDGANDVALNLKNNFNDIKVILVVREQGDIIRSAYRYTIQQGLYLKKFNEFLAQNSSHLIEKYSYHHILEMYVSAIGLENIHVLPFEMMAKSVDQFRLEFMRHFMHSGQWRTRSKYKNESSKLGINLEFQRKCNLILQFISIMERRYKGNKGHEVNIVRNRLRIYNQLLNSFFDICPRRLIPKSLPLELTPDYKRSYELSNHFMEADFGVNLAPFGYMKT